KWVDDFLVIRLPHQSWTEAEFIALTSYCSIPWSLKKLHCFAVIQRNIAFDWDLDCKLVSLPEEKLLKVQQLISSWQAAGASFMAKEVAGLHSKLVHVACIFP
ncbi:uncharacterized protein HD556DRAFT_1191708, partial [Suillus plorans]